MFHTFSSQYHQFANVHHSFLNSETQFPFRQLGKGKNRTKTCWLDSFLFFISRPIHGDTFQGYIEKLKYYKDSEKCVNDVDVMGDECVKYYNELVEYLKKPGDIIPEHSLSDAKEIQVKKKFMCKVLNTTEIDSKWKKGHNVFQILQDVMTKYGGFDDTTSKWFKPEFKYEPKKKEKTFAWPVIPLPKKGEMKLSDKLKKIMTKEGPSSEYIVISVFKENRNHGSYQLEINDRNILYLNYNGYKLIALFPYDNCHVTCISRVSYSEGWEGFDNESKEIVNKENLKDFNNIPHFKYKGRSFLAIYQNIDDDDDIDDEDDRPLPSAYDSSSDSDGSDEDGKSEYDSSSDTDSFDDTDSSSGSSSGSSSDPDSSDESDSDKSDQKEQLCSECLGSKLILKTKKNTRYYAPCKSCKDTNNLDDSDDKSQDSSSSSGSDSSSEWSPDSSSSSGSDSE